MDSWRPSSVPGSLCVALTPVVAFFGGWLGLRLGGSFGYMLAWLVDRDIAELKDAWIWCTIMGAPVTAAASVWFMLWLIRSPRWSQQAALVAFGVAVLAAATLILAAYPWPGRYES